jgi:hypothetical protein
MTNPAKSESKNLDVIPSRAPFPAGLVEWAGYQKGGVRKPFCEGSGRPCKSIIETSLLSRLRAWANDIASKVPETPRSLFLVGGPGNGKTEAIEQLLYAFDRELGADSEIIKECERQFAGNQDHPVPRMVTLQTVNRIKVTGITEIAILQDASMADPKVPGKSAAELFLSEVDAVARGSSERIYLACVNRGVLDEALMAAGKGGHEDGRRLLEAITRSIALSPYSPACWPLDGYPSVAAWPMDIETLITRPNGEIISGPAGQVLTKALNPANWPAAGTCAAGDRCPFCGSYSYLQRDLEKESLLHVLRWSELALGKRWNFRDLFSLFSYLLAGAGAEEGQGSTPCEWAAKLHQLAHQYGSGHVTLRLKAPFVLASALYQQALFPVWPRPNARSLRRDIYDLGLKDDRGLMGLFYFLTAPLRSSIPAALQSQLALMTDALDPAMADPASQMDISTRTIVWGRDVDTRFSQSVREGYENCLRLLHPLENDVLKLLIESDDRLSSSQVRQLQPATAKRLQNMIRDFACRLVRRSLGVRFGIVKDQSFLMDFQQVLEHQPQLVHKAVRQVEGLLNVRERFVLTLNSTFGEPVLPASRRAVLSTLKQRVKAVDGEVKGRPVPSLRFLSIGSGERAHVLPLTFDLFCAVRKLEEGMLPASLPRAVVALLDASRSKLAGSVVRDSDLLEDASIELGQMGFTVRCELGQFVVSREEDT